MLSVINFALTAPVVVRELEVRAIESDDGPVPSNPAPPIDSPSPSSGPGSTAAAQSYSLSAGPSSPKDSHVLTSRAPTDPSHPPGFPPTDPSHPPGFPPIAASPKSPQIITLSSDESGEAYSSSSWVPTDSDSSLPSSWRPTTDSAHGTSRPPRPQQIVALPESPQIVALPESPQIVSSDNSYSSSSWVPTDSDSSSTSLWAPQDHAISPPTPLLSSQHPPPNLPWSWSSRTRTRVPPPQDPGDHLPTEQSHPSSSDQLATGQSHLISPDQLVTSEPHPPTLSTVGGPSPIPGPTDNRPQPASPSNPGPSTERNPPSPGTLYLEEHEIWGSLGDILKGKFKRRFSGSGSLNAAQGGLAGTFN